MDLNALINILSDIRDKEGNLECEAYHDGDVGRFAFSVSLVKIGKTPVVVIS